MPAKCPLCYQPLGSNDRLQRVCLSHRDRAETFAFDIEKPRFYCPANSCDNPQSIQTGVFLRHVGCSMLNPYASAAPGSFFIPKSDSLTRDDGKVFEVKHWMFTALRELAEVEPDAAEMWFPLQMFRAYNWYPLDENQRVGASIRLAGAKNTGKTVLATMALSPYGYSQPAFHVENYIYVSPNLGIMRPQEQFLQGLLPFSMLREQQNDPAWVTSTPPARANLKAAFFRTNVENRTLGREVVQYVLNAKAPWNALLFYDTSGEENEEPGEVSKTPVDIGAVLIDGSQLRFVNGRGGMSVQTAAERMRTIAAKRKCLIVTKADLMAASGKLSDEDAGLIAAIRAGGEVDSAAERAMVKRWLTGPEASPVEQLLSRDLGSTPVFLIWTEGLDETKAGELPRSYGLDRFVAWCLTGKSVKTNSPSKKAK